MAKLKIPPYSYIPHPHIETEKLSRLQRSLTKGWALTAR